MADKIDQYHGYLKPGWDAANPKLKKSLRGSKPILSRGYGGPEEGWKQTSKGMSIPADLAPKNKSIEAEALLKAAAKKNPAVTAMLNALKKLVPGLNVAAFMVDSDVLGSSTLNNPKATEAVAQYLFDNGGQWPDEGPGSFKEGYKGDKTEILNLYQAMVEQASLRDMAHEQDMKTSEKMPLYSTEQQEQMREAQKAYLRNM